MLPKVDGIYDVKTIRQLLELGVRRFSFDMRPQSLNFVQHYRVLDIVSEIGLGSDKVFCFHFGNEFPMLLEKFITDLNERVSATSEDWQQGKLQLEFSGREDFEQMDQFHCSYRWHFYKGANWNKAAKAKYLSGLILPFYYLEDSLEEGTLHSLCMNLHTTFSTCSFHLSHDWGSNVFPTLTELFDFDDVALPIDPNVEVCFRNVDQTKLTLGLRPFLNSL
tara:strand:+ start:4107 stop:4769 length:663 start_codon:yes stop_codon:yes gene_type:complete